MPGSASPYPVARKVDEVDDYHGVKVADPYRWLEDPTPPETALGRGARTRSPSRFLDTIPEREAIRERLTELWNYERYGVPVARAAATSISATTGCRTRASSTSSDPLDGEPRVLLDPNTLSHGRHGRPDRHRAVSDDGKLLAYGLASAGSDWQEWRVRDVDTGRDLAGPAQVGQVLRRRLDPRRPAASSTAATTSRARAQPARGGQLLPEALLPPARHAAVATTSSSTSGRTRRSGASAPTSPRTAATWSSTSGKGTRPKNRILYKDLEASRARSVELLVDDFDADVRLHRQRRPGLLVPDRPRRAARPGDRHRHARRRTASTGRRSSPRRGDARERVAPSATASSLTT